MQWAGNLREVVQREGANGMGGHSSTGGTARAGHILGLAVLLHSRAWGEGGKHGHVVKEGSALGALLCCCWPAGDGHGSGRGAAAWLQTAAGSRVGAWTWNSWKWGHDRPHLPKL